MMKKLLSIGLITASLVTPFILKDVNAEELKASGTISASCSFLSNNSGTLIASNDLKQLGTIYGNQPTSINYTIAISGSANLDFSEPSTLAFDGADITGEVAIVEDVSYRDSLGNEVELGQPEGLVSLVGSSVYDFAQDVSMTKVDDTEFSTGTYEYTKVVTCTGGIVEEPVEPIEPIEG